MCANVELGRDEPGFQTRIWTFLQNAGETFQFGTSQALLQRELPRCRFPMRALPQGHPPQEAESLLALPCPRRRQKERSQPQLRLRLPGKPGDHMPCECDGFSDAGELA